MALLNQFRFRCFTILQSTQRVETDLLKQEEIFIFICLSTGVLCFQISIPNSYLNG